MERGTQELNFIKIFKSNDSRTQLHKIQTKSSFSKTWLILLDVVPWRDTPLIYAVHRELCSKWQL